MKDLCSRPKQGLSEHHIKTLGDMVDIPSWVDTKNGVDERKIMKYLKSYLHRYCDDLREIPLLDDGAGWQDAMECGEILPEDKGPRKDLIGVKGNGDHAVYLLGHMDTIKPKGWEYRMRRSDGTLWGLGVGDMKAGLMVMADAMKYAQVPSHMTVVTAFLADEEYRSRGAYALLQAIRKGELPEPDIILSPEIIARWKGLGKTDVPLVYARMGRSKFRGSLFVNGRHGSLEGVGGQGLTCLDAHTKLYEGFKERFEEWKNADLPPGQYNGDELISQMECVIGSLDDDSELSSPGGDYILSHLSSSRSVAESRELFREFYRDIIDTVFAGGAALDRHTFDADRTHTSYEPYAVPTDTPEAQAVAGALQGIYGDMYRVVFCRDTSPSDMNVLVGAHEGMQKPFWPGYEIGPRGKGAHGRGECVHYEDLARMIEFYRAVVRGEVY